MRCHQISLCAYDYDGKQLHYFPLCMIVVPLADSWTPCLTTRQSHSHCITCAKWCHCLSGTVIVFLLPVLACFKFDGYLLRDLKFQ